MEVARASDNRARELEAQCAEKLAKLEASHDAVVAAKDAAVLDMKEQFVKLERSRDAVMPAQNAIIAVLNKQNAGSCGSGHQGRRIRQPRA
jgi:hypothetical protein